MDQKIQLAIKEKSVINRIDLMANPLFTLIKMDYQRTIKFKPPIINPYDGTKYLINYVQSFRSHMIYYRTLDKMMCRSFLFIFKNTIRNWYLTLKLNSNSSFTDFTE